MLRLVLVLANRRRIQQSAQKITTNTKLAALYCIAAADEMKS